MEQLWLDHPFGCEGVDVRVRFRDYRWWWTLSEWNGEEWCTIDDGAARSSDAALGACLQALTEYREVLLEPAQEF